MALVTFASQKFGIRHVGIIGDGELQSTELR